MNDKLNVAVVSAKDLRPGMNLVNIGVVGTISEYANVIVLTIENTTFIQTDLKTITYLPFELLIIYKKSHKIYKNVQKQLK